MDSGTSLVGRETREGLYPNKSDGRGQRSPLSIGHELAARRLPFFEESDPDPMQSVGGSQCCALLAHAFWNKSGAAQVRDLTTFFEHVGLIGGFLLACILVARDRPGR